MMDLESRESANSRLSRISTLWEMVAQAHGDTGEAATTAQHALLQRYSAAVYRYLVAAARDETVADDLSQEFAVKWLSGGFKNADPSRGRFRTYLATALHHLVMDHYRRRAPLAVDWQSGSLLHPQVEEDPNAAFLPEWRQELLDAAWRELKCEEGPYYAVLRWRSSNPDKSIDMMAEELSTQFDRPFTAVGVRQTLHRARKRYADILVAEVARTLGGASNEVVEQELSDLGLLSYCRPASRRA